MTFVAGAILEGPDPTNLKPLVEQAMPMLIELLKDPSVVVRDTTGENTRTRALVASQTRRSLSSFDKSERNST